MYFLLFYNYISLINGHGPFNTQNDLQEDKTAVTFKYL